MKGSIVDDVEPQTSGFAYGVTDDAGDGDRGADRLGPVDHGAQGPDAGVAPLFVPPDTASRTEYTPGELAQCDLWFRLAQIPLGTVALSERQDLRREDFLEDRARAPALAWQGRTNGELLPTRLSG